MRSLYLVAMVACSEPAATVPISGTAGPAARAAACVARAPDPDPGRGTYPLRADSIAIAGDEVRLCWGRPPARSCWRVDVARRVFVAQPVTAVPADDTPRFVQPPRATATARPDGTLSLCRPGGLPCRSFAVANPTKDPEAVGVSDDLAVVSIGSGDVLRIYDAASARLRATIRGWPDSPMSGNRFMYPPIFAAPDRMIVWYSWSPVSEQGRIFDLSGAQLAIIGGGEHASIEPPLSAWRVRDTEWAIKDEANALLTVDVRDPRATATYDLTPLLAQPRPARDSDTGILDVLAVAGTADRLVVVTGENPVTIGVVERATTRVVRLDAPRCH